MPDSGVFLLLVFGRIRPSILGPSGAANAKRSRACLRSLLPFPGGWSPRMDEFDPVSPRGGLQMPCRGDVLADDLGEGPCCGPDAGRQQ